MSINGVQVIQTTTAEPDWFHVALWSKGHEWVETACDLYRLPLGPHGYARLIHPLNTHTPDGIRRQLAEDDMGALCPHCGAAYARNGWRRGEGTLRRFSGAAGIEVDPSTAEGRPVDEIFARRMRARRRAP